MTDEVWRNSSTRCMVTVLIHEILLNLLPFCHPVLLDIGLYYRESRPKGWLLTVMAHESLSCTNRQTITRLLGNIFTFQQPLHINTNLKFQKFSVCNVAARVLKCAWCISDIQSLVC